jgi:hypothetical protein
MAQPPICVVSGAELCQKFEEHDFLGRLERGELTQRLIEDRPAPPYTWLKSGSRSQIIAYVDPQGVRVAEVHQYLQPDGSIGASGLPDPKRLLINDLLYIVVKPDLGKRSR